MGRVHIASAFLLAAFVLAAPAAAQQGTAQISGRVTDTQGAVLPGVSVVVRNEETGAARELTSSVEGSYSAAQLTPGRYAVIAKLTGFRTMERSHLVLQVGTTLTIDLSLPVGGIEEKPGIPPGPRHQVELTKKLKEGGIAFLMVDDFYDPALPNALSKDSGVPVVILPNQPAAGGYVEFFGGVVDKLVKR